VTYVALMRRIGMGAHVKNTERSRNDLRPQASERAPMRGAERKARIPLIPWTMPFLRNVPVGNAFLSACHIQGVTCIVKQSNYVTA